MGFDLLKIKNDIKWHLDVIKDEYKFTLGELEIFNITSDQITIECWQPNEKLSDVELTGIQDAFLDDYWMFLSKHHPEVKENQIKMISKV